MNESAFELTPWQPCVATEWSHGAAKHFFEIELGKMLQPEPNDSDDIEVPYLKSQHVQRNEVRLDDLPTMWASPKEVRALTIKKGDLLVCEGGDVGRAAMLQTEPSVNCIIQNALHLVRAYGDNDVRFLGYLLDHSAAHGWFDVLCNRSTIAHFTVDKFKEFPIFLPTGKKQRAIADHLDRETHRIDDLIAAKQRWLEVLAEKRVAVVSRAISEGAGGVLSWSSSPLPWLERVPSHWTLRKLGYVSRIGNGSTPNRDNRDYWEGGHYPWLNSSFANDDQIFAADEFVTHLALDECHLPLVEPNSLLMGITGQGKTRGKCAILRFEATINQHLAYITPDTEAVSVEYLQHVLNSAYDFIRDESDGAGSTKGAITCEQIAQFKVPVPPIAEQRAIVAHIQTETAKIDALKTTTERSLTLLRERRAALIAEAVTGRL